MNLRSLLVVIACSLVAASCTHRLAATHPVNVNPSYFDLTPGTRVRVIWPNLKSGSVYLGFAPSDLLGVHSVRYVAEGRGRVRLRFVSAERTQEGAAVAEASAPALPFPLPKHAAHMRVIYLVRSSAADHNMALVAARKRNLLDDFTRRFQENPSLCGAGGEVTCTWIPAGVAVRPES